MIYFQLLVGMCSIISLVGMFTTGIQMVRK